MEIVPVEWLVWGVLPGAVEMESPDGLWVVRIDPAIKGFRCRLIAQYDPDHPCEDLEVLSLLDVRAWLARTFARI